MVPATWEFASNKKGVKRYTCAALRELVRLLHTRCSGTLLWGMHCTRRALFCCAVHCTVDACGSSFEACVPRALPARAPTTQCLLITAPMYVCRVQVRAREAAYDAKERAQGGILQAGIVDCWAVL